MALITSKTKVVYISSRHKQHIIDTSDTDICYKKSTVSSKTGSKNATLSRIVSVVVSFDACMIPINE